MLVLLKNTCQLPIHARLELALRSDVCPFRGDKKKRRVWRSQRSGRGVDEVFWKWLMSAVLPQPRGERSFFNCVICWRLIYQHDAFEEKHTMGPVETNWCSSTCSIALIYVLWPLESASSNWHPILRPKLWVPTSVPPAGRLWEACGSLFKQSTHWVPFRMIHVTLMSNCHPGLHKSPWIKLK